MSLLRQRLVYHRDRRLRELARGQQCTVRIAWLPTHDSALTTVWAHSNLAEHAKGGGVKAHDCFGFFACHRCHAEIDQGRKLVREERRAVQREAMQATREVMVKYRLILLADDFHIEDVIDNDDLWLEHWLNGSIYVKERR